MSKKFDRRLLDTNAVVMGGGVGLAALESMFNLVQTQSLISASMVRDHDQAYSLSLETLALAIGEVLEPGANRTCRSCGCRSSAVQVDIPASPVSETDTYSSSGTRRGALANADVLSDMASDSQSATTTTSQTTESGVSLDNLLMKILEMLGGHMTEMNDGYRESNRRNLMVS